MRNDVHIPILRFKMGALMKSVFTSIIIIAFILIVLLLALIIYYLGITPGVMGLVFGAICFYLVKRNIQRTKLFKFAFIILMIAMVTAIFGMVFSEHGAINSETLLQMIKPDNTHNDIKHNRF